MRGLLLIGALALGLPLLGVLALLLGSSGPGAGCALATGGGGSGALPSGGWVATSYGPPWGGIQGNGVTATGIDLTHAPAAYVIAVDPSIIPLRGYVHVTPNPFGTRSAFYAGDTGGAIRGRHIDIYDWRGRAQQDAWGTRTVSVTPAANPGAGNLLGGVAPVAAGGGGAVGGEGGGSAAGCVAGVGDGTLGLTPGETARVLPDGSAAAPAQAPAAVRRAIAAGNLIHTLPYPEPDVHYGSLARLWPAYDCSGATSFVLYGAGLLGPGALDSTGLEGYGDAGAGRWITVYANSAHAWIVVAGIALDTADYGGPGVPAGSGARWRSQPLANLADGGSYVVRHPAGL